MSNEGVTNETRDFVGSIRQAVETLSGSNYPTIRMTAEFGGWSVRTLQRRLAEAGVSHRMLIEQARFATAAAVIERTHAMFNTYWQPLVFEYGLW